MLKIKISNPTIDPNNSMYIFTEINSTHNDKFEAAFKIIEAAKLAGGVVVKLQAYRGGDV